MTDRIYLDHAATTPLCAEAEAALRAGFLRWANPSSPHAEGRKARELLEQARSRIKSALGWEGELIFTSGASEALAIALTQAKLRLSACSTVEHDAVLRHAGAAQRWPVGMDGLAQMPQDFAGGLVALQHVNNETGVIQPVSELAAAIRAQGGAVLCDCAQSAGKIALPEAEIIALSGHKFGAPIGIGALLLRDFGLLKPSGGQERGYRGGTENLPGALAMAAALEAGSQWLARAQQLRARLEAGLLQADAEVVAADIPRIATIGAYRMPGLSSAAQLIRFDAAGFAVSAGSACSSGSLKPSHVLAAMGLAHPGEVIRVSLGRETDEAQIDAFVAAWRAIAPQARAA